MKSENPKPNTQNPQILDPLVVSFFISKKYFEKTFPKNQKKIQNPKRQTTVMSPIFMRYKNSWRCKCFIDGRSCHPGVAK